VTAQGPSAGDAATVQPGKGDAEPQRQSLMRRAMARRMVETTSVPCFYLRVTADVTELLEHRAALREAAGGERVPTVNDAIVRAAAVALRAHPEVNASFSDGSVIVHPRVNVGIAIAVEGGLVAPAIYDADTKDVAAISAAAREAADLAARRRLGREILADATFTVSNLGMFGIEDFDPIINPPQAAILGVGAAIGAPGDRRNVRLTLGCDHRVLTGAEGAVFLTDIEKALGKPDDIFATEGLAT
jgi:pyruvate dehydrogenase E2 component (dihydrolipoamide acetyltransferase)